METFFLFKDGLGRIYKVAWDGKKSGLYPRRPSGHWFYLRDVKDEEIETFMEHEIPAADYDRYDSIVEPIGRLFFMVKSATRPDVGAAQTTRAEAEAAARQAGTEQARLERDVERFVELTGRLEELRGELEGITSQLSVAGQVSEMVPGHNPRSMSLHRVVLAARLEAVAEAEIGRVHV